MNKVDLCQNKYVIKFIKKHCTRCNRDRFMSEDVKYEACNNNELCDILTRAFKNKVDEWIEFDEGQTKCLMFSEKG